MILILGLRFKWLNKNVYKINVFAQVHHCWVFHEMVREEQTNQKPFPEPGELKKTQIETIELLIGILILSKIVILAISES